jgi:hypothetical protein
MDNLTWVKGAREDLDETSRKILAAQSQSGTSIFDPVLCELAYRWFCKLSVEDQIPDHSVFSRARHERFRESDALRRVFEGVRTASAITLLILGIAAIFKVSRKAAIIPVLPIWIIGMIMIWIGGKFGGGLG